MVVLAAGMVLVVGNVQPDERDSCVLALQLAHLLRLEEAMLVAMTSNLAANTTLTAKQQAAHLTLVESHLDAMVTAAHSSGAGIGPMDPGMGGMMGR